MNLLSLLQLTPQLNLDLEMRTMEHLLLLLELELQILKLLKAITMVV